MSRSLAREVAFKALFQLDFNNGDAEDREFYENLAINAVLTGGKKLSSSLCLYVEQTVKGTRNKLDEIDELISEHLKKGWTLRRLATVDRNILRLAVYEIKFSEQMVPKGIIINEAVEIAKKYGTDNSSRFINGILTVIAK
ncbi:MAG: transcription antitermination factor NusB [Selenomonadaceae bacterium]|nr:transcription antitermination factor NusB [Selenomonadaceae bacterium]